MEETTDWFASTSWITLVYLSFAYIWPVSIHKAEAMDILEKHYKILLKQILSVPITVADPAIHVYLLSGALPTEALINKRILSPFGNITRLPCKSIEVRLAKRQLEIKKTSKSHSWLIAVKKILIKYVLPLPETLIDNPPTEYKIVRNNVTE